MPRPKVTGYSSRKRKASLRASMDAIRASRWSNKENVFPLPQAPASPTVDWKTKFCKVSKRHHSTQRALQREKKKSSHLRDLSNTVLARGHETEAKTSLTIRTLKHENECLTRRAEAITTTVTGLLEGKMVAQHKMRAMKEKIRRFSCNIERATQKAKISYVIKLRKKGIYTVQARQLARSLVHAGCAPRKVSRVICEVAGVLGVSVVGNMSARTVQRTQLEGLVATEIQCGYELGAAEAVTISQDSTSNRHVNIEAHHFATRVADYSKGETLPSESSEHKVRLLRVDSTLDHTSERSRESWISQLREVSDTYKASPLGKRPSAPHFSLRHFALILKGMHGDHASSEKSTSNLMQEWKQEETLVDLGEKRMLETSDFASLILFLNHKKAEHIEKLGGHEKWQSLSATDRSRAEEQLMHNIKQEVGKEVYNTLSDFDRRMLDLFIWAGCCMHKDQNSFKGGNSAMLEYWIKNNLPGPILLANKFNAQKIRDMLDPSRKNTPVTPDEQAALELTTRGGAKTAALAGALFNNKDDKKGYGDTYQFHREALTNAICSRFPDVNNTCFNSHTEAAAELLINLAFYLRFLEHIRDAKKQPGWTNIELNLYSALKDIPTLTELTAMVLYSQSVTHPYMRQVRGPGTEKTNILDLAPLHNAVRDHCEKIVANPDLLVSSDATYEQGTLDGEKWEDTKAIEAVKAMLPNLPHLRGIVQTFFQGALATWVRFSSEFAPGGLIDTANAEEKKLAWMPSTNDTNEGALGAYRVYMRNKPSTTHLQYNAYAVWERNDTQSFVDALFKQEDHAFLRKKAREWDRQGRERERKRKLKEHEDNQVAVRRGKEAQKIKDAEDRRARLLKVVIAARDTNFMRMTVLQLDEQLDALKEIYKDLDIPNKSARGLKSTKIKLLEDAIDRFQSRKDSLQDIVEENLMNIVKSWEEEDELEIEMEGV